MDDVDGDAPQDSAEVAVAVEMVRVLLVDYPTLAGAVATIAADIRASLEKSTEEAVDGVVSNLLSGKTVEKI